ncbi:MAG: DNA polymerase I [Anaerolineaceae bacterium]|nr:DNA polymerase I [Anaerolineaceae bacterium]
MPPILYLIDGHALAYRMYFAMTSAGGDRFTTAKGEPTAGVYGFVSVILRLLENEKPEYLAFTFDTGKTFRDEIFPEYKATREKMPDDLRLQVKRIREFVDALNLPRLEVEGYEADDVLGTIAKQGVKNGFGVKIYTGDRDLLQLVDDRVIVNLPGKRLSDSRDFTAQDVKEYMGVFPNQVIDYKALVGDSSDNIPGVYGVGDKTATKLLEEYKTLDKIYASLDEIPARVKNKLVENKEMAYLSQKLATIVTDAPVSVDIHKAHISNIDYKSVKVLFTELEFRSLLRRLSDLSDSIGPGTQNGQLSFFTDEPSKIAEGPYQPETIIVRNSDQLSQLVTTLNNAEMISFDTETTGTDPFLADLVGISIAVESHKGYYIPVGHQEESDQLSIHDVLEAISPAFTNAAIPKMGHNIKYDYQMLKQAGLQATPLSFDSMIAEWLINPSNFSFGLKNMAADYLGIQMTRISDLIGTGKKQISMAEVSIDQAAPYAVADAEIVLQLYPLLQKKLADRDAEKLLETMEMPLVPIISDMEEEGIAIDEPFFEQMTEELKNRTFEIQETIYKMVGQTFNLNSTQQLSGILFDTLGLEPPNRKKKTASGFYSTSADVLEEIANQHPIVELLLEYRELAKLQSTYVLTLPKQINPKTGRIHSSFNQTGSVTGRLASSDPNLQNIPTRTDLGRKIRNGFVAGKGNVFLAIDYSQIELRIVAHMSQDQAMMLAFQQNLDIHAATAAAIYQIPLTEVNKDQRRHAKAINFGLIYGMSPFGLSRSTGLTLAEAENFVKAYFLQFPGVKMYLDEMKLLAAQNGYVETILGHRRYFPNLSTTTNANIRNREEREAINAPIQGTAADIIKLSMLQIPQDLLSASLHAKMILQIHDELIFECPENELTETVKVVTNIMENVLVLSVPILTEARSGLNWGSLTTL